jgi:hypothetical protein
MGASSRKGAGARVGLSDWRSAVRITGVDAVVE